MYIYIYMYRERDVYIYIYTHTHSTVDYSIDNNISYHMNTSLVLGAARWGPEGRSVRGTAKGSTII